MATLRDSYVAEPQALNTQADRIAEAKRVQAAREQGIRAQAIKEGREKERAEICATLGVKRIEDAGLIEELRKEHRNELVSLQLTNDQHAERLEHTTRHRVGAARGMWLAIGILAGAGVGVVATQKVMRDGMFGLVAASRSSREVWQPPEAPAIRETPRCENVADCAALQ